MSYVTQYSIPASLPWSERLVAKLSERDYRHAYMTQGVKTWIARQVRALREQRNWSQDDLGRETGKPQSAISRLEDPDYGKLTLQTLFALARSYDLGLLVQFVEWSDWLSRMNDTSTDNLQKASFSADALTDLAIGQVGMVDPLPELTLSAAVSSQEYHGVTFHGYHGAGLYVPRLRGGHEMTVDTASAVGQMAAGVTTYSGCRWSLPTIECDDESVDPDFAFPHAFIMNTSEIEDGR